MSLPLTIYCLPVSGTNFPVQLEELCLVSNASNVSGEEKPRKPDVVLASSGGNISAYMAYSSDWDCARIMSQLDFFDSESFLTGWSDILPIWLSFFRSRTLFSCGYGFTQAFRRMFSLTSARAGAEIWTGSVEHRTRLHKLFTNKAEGHTILKPPLRGEETTGPIFAQSDSAGYFDGDVRSIAEIVRASASIPYLVEPVEFGGEKYSDGGGIFASPFSSFSNNIYTLGTTGGRTVRMTMFASSNIDKLPTSSLSAAKELVDLIVGISAQEFRVFVNLIISLGAKNVPERIQFITPQSLGEVYTRLDSTNKHYAIILYPDSIPETKHSINLTYKFASEDIKRDMSAARGRISAYVWS